MSIHGAKLLVNYWQAMQSYVRLRMRQESVPGFPVFHIDHPRFGVVHALSPLAVICDSSSLICTESALKLAMAASDFFCKSS